LDRFLSHYTNRFDAKGRVSVPASFRAVLAKDGFDGIFIHPSLDAPALSRLGWEALTPLETDVINYEDKSVDRPAPLDPRQGGFLNVDNPDVVLLTWKQAEDRNGYILRFLEIAGKAAKVGVSSPILDIQSAWRCSAMEENQQPLAIAEKGVKFDVKPYEIVTARVEGTPILAEAK